MRIGCCLCYCGWFFSVVLSFQFNHYRIKFRSREYHLLASKSDVSPPNVTWWDGCNVDTATERLKSIQYPSLDDYSAVAQIYCDHNELEKAIALAARHNLSDKAHEKLFSVIRWQDALKLANPHNRQWVIQVCVKAQQTERAIPLLNDAPMESWELVIQSLCRRGHWRRARQVLEQAPQPPSTGTYNTLLQSCSRAKQAVVAKSLLRRMTSPDVYSYNAVLSACVNAGRTRDALKLFQEMQRLPFITPDIYTYTNAIRAANPRQALALLQVVQDLKIPLDAHIYTAAMKATHNARKTLQLLAEMQERGIEPSPITYSVAIAQCKGEYWRDALRLLDEMDNPNLYTINAAISAVSKAAKQNPDETDFEKIVLNLLSKCESLGLKPDGFTYSGVISCCQDWSTALRLIEEMQASGSTPNKVAWTAAINCCGKAGKVDEALKLFKDLRAAQLTVDLVAYNAVLYACRVARQPDLAWQLWSNLALKPDLITITEVIGVLTDDTRIAQVFQKAVDLGLVFDHMDSDSDVNLSGLSLPVARAALAYLLPRSSSHLTLITGVGPSLKQHVQDVLLEEYGIGSEVPKLAQGTVLLKAEDVEKWRERQANMGAA